MLDVRPQFLLLWLLLLQLPFLLRGKGCASLVAEWQVGASWGVHSPYHRFWCEIVQAAPEARPPFQAPAAQASMCSHLELAVQVLGPRSLRKPAVPALKKCRDVVALGPPCGQPWKKGPTGKALTLRLNIRIRARSNNYSTYLPN